MSESDKEPSRENGAAVQTIGVGTVSEERFQNEQVDSHLTRFERLCEEQFQTMCLMSQDSVVADESVGEEGSPDDGNPEMKPLLQRPACVWTDHCPNPCDPYVWDDEGENVVDMGRCDCDCCMGKCVCREERRSGGVDDDHTCMYTYEDDGESR